METNPTSFYKILNNTESTAFKNCPVKTTLKFVGKRWAFEIIRDLTFGYRRFKDFLELNPISSKVLSQRLKEMETNGFILKDIVSKTPLKIEYKLTEKGYDLNHVLHQLALFSYRNYQKEVLKDTNLTADQFESESKRLFNIP